MHFPSLTFSWMNIFFEWFFIKLWLKCFHVVYITTSYQWFRCIITWSNGDRLNYQWITNITTWWRHQIETFFALLAFCEGNPMFTGGFPSQRLVTQSFDVFFYLRLNKRVSKQPWGWWFETPSRSLWRHCYEYQPHSCCAKRLGLGRIDRLVQERRDSSALAMELRLSCTNLSILAIHILRGLPISWLTSHI